MTPSPTTSAPARPAAHAGRVHAALQRAGASPYLAGLALAGWIALVLSCVGCVCGSGTVNFGWRSALVEHGDALNEVDGGGKPELTIPLTGGK